MATKEILRTIITVRFNPGRDLLAVIVSWFLVTGALYTATFIVGSDAAGGMLYFLLYAVVTATLFGVGVPLYWTVVVRKRPLSDLGITTRLLGISLVIQVILGGVQYYTALRDTAFPPTSELLPFSLALLPRRDFCLTYINKSANMINKIELHDYIQLQEVIKWPRSLC